MLQLSNVHLIFLINHGQIGCLDTIEHEHLYMVKKSTLIINDIGTCNSEQ